jgi:hypothetical protein
MTLWLAGGFLAWAACAGLLLAVARATRPSAPEVLASALPALLLLALTGRALFAGLAGGALLAALALADATKRRVLGEPLVFSDWRLLPGVRRHPELYLPFAGLTRIRLGLAVALVLGAALLWVEPEAGLTLRSLAMAGVIIGATLLRQPLPAWRERLTGDAEQDTARLGTLGAAFVMAAVARSERPARRMALPAPAPLRVAEPAPHVVLVQAESFADPRGVVPGAPAMPALDALRAEALGWGRFAAPAHGANTLRAEFGVLTGIAEEALGLDRFHPYAHWARESMPSLPRALAQAGYATAALHPFDARFFGRHHALPALGFQRFLAERAFAGAARARGHVSDAALAARAVAMLREARQPMALLLITVAAHGPWRCGAAEWAGCMAEADALLDALRAAAPVLDRPLLLAHWSDHAPALEGLAVAPAWLLWRSDRRGEAPPREADPAALHGAIRAALS